MKNWTALAFLVIYFTGPSSLFAQISEALKNLEGSWYQETRNSITYANWQHLDNQSFESQMFSVVCDDTILISYALLQFTEEAATLTITSNGRPQRYQLTQWDNTHLVWKNESAGGLPQDLEWKFLRGGYSTFIADGNETDFRKDIRQPFKLRFRASLGANLNQYANPVGDNRFLANINMASVQGVTQMLSGREAALSVGLIFPSAPMCINFEMGMAYRQVGVNASFYHPKAAAFTDRDGYYRNYNYYLAIVPEIFVGKKRDFSISAGFYADIFQQRYYRGNSGTVNADTNTSHFLSPDNDIDPEHGLTLGFHYRMPSLGHFRPQAYMRYTHGLNNTQVRAVSLGVALEFEMLKKNGQKKDLCGILQISQSRKMTDNELPTPEELEIPLTESPTPTAPPPLDVDPVMIRAERVKAEIGQVIVGQEDMLDLLLVALFTGGHVLLEGVPGIAKTLTAKLLARTLHTEFSRIQFTPDLMPADVVGTPVFNMKASDFNFKAGPIFSNIVLIDEINRAPAKTQASLFEVMEERQVTVDGTTYPMSEPFFVVATQNPIEQEGTYKLPEAQLDRFLFKVILSYPSLEEEQSILRRFRNDFSGVLRETVKPVLSPADIADCQRIIEKVYIREELLDYIAAIVHSTRSNADLFLGASPRASLSLMKASKAVAAMAGRSFVTPDDIRYVSFPVLNHRVILTPEREMEGYTTKEVLDDIVKKIEVPR